MARRPFLDRVPIPAKVALAALALYFFLVGIGALGAAFKMMGSGVTDRLLRTEAGPLVSLFIGILATTLVQSSSTTTSIVVGLVATGVLGFHSAVYMVMGANVGTTVTNTIVSLGHMRRTHEYRRAFAAATVHDFFNMIVLLVLFPLEVCTGGLDFLAGHATDLFEGVGGFKLANPIKLVTKPTITALHDLVVWLGGGGVALLILAVALTFGMLISLVKILRSVMVTKMENLFDRVLFRSPGRALAVRLLMTMLVQSSSITTAVAVPLVGAGLITLRQVLPYTMGANIGTTVTALVASLAALAGAEAGAEGTARLGVRLAFHHVLFNVVGVAMLWHIRWIPIAIAEGFAGLAMKNRLIPLVYIVVTFYLGPFLIILLGR
ncbi:MAG: Na/Pi symporter [Planctomycetota bacterium]